MIDKTTKAGLMSFQNLIDLMREGSTKSLIEYTKGLRAEPYVMLDSECVFLDETSDVMQSLQSQYSGFYLLAMSTMSTLNNPIVVRHMDKINPDRSVLNAMRSNTSELITAFEDITEDLTGDSPARDDKTSVKELEEKLLKNKKGTRVSSGKNAVDEVKQLANLSVGKIIECEIVEGNNKITLPISIRLLASSLPSNTLVHILTNGEVEKDFWERWRGWRSGRLSLMDMIFCKDLIDIKRKAMMKDDTGVYRNIMGRKQNNKLATIASGRMSVGTYSNMCVITETTARELELKMVGGDLKDFKARERLFENTALMILAVIDRDWGRVTFYYQSISRPLEISFRDLKASNKGSGPNVAEILNAYKLGTTPSL